MKVTLSVICDPPLKVVYICSIHNGSFVGLTIIDVVMKRHIVLIYFLFMLQKFASSVYCIENKSVFQWKNRDNSISLTEKDLKGTLVNWIYHSRNGEYFEKTSTVPLRRNWER